MTHTLVVRSRAEQDALDAYKWYEKEYPGLGIRFLESLDKFPYGLFYLFENDEVVVIAILGQEQRPGLWGSRR